MISWLRIVGLARIIIGNAVAVLLLRGVVRDLAGLRPGGGCPSVPLRYPGVFAISLGLGLFALGWLLYRIFWPKVVSISWAPTLKLGPVITTNPTIPEVEFPFASTHPSYIIADLVMLPVVYLLYLLSQSATGCSYRPIISGDRFALGLALLIPALRLLGWYGLGRRPPEKSLVGAHKPVLLLCAILALPVLILCDLWWKQHRVEAQVPIADARALAGGLAAHPELADKIVRLRGTLLRDKVKQCVCRAADECTYAEMPLSVGDGLQVVVQARATDVWDLKKKAQGAVGTAYETFGRLQPYPPGSDAVSQRRPPGKQPPPTCGASDYGPPPPAGRALLLVEYP